MPHRASTLCLERITCGAGSAGPLWSQISVAWVVYAIRTKFHLDDIGNCSEHTVLNKMGWARRGGAKSLEAIWLC